MSPLYIIRHGETKLNANSIIIGWQDIELTNKGKKTAKKIASFLKNKKIDKIVSSNLKRAKETASIIAQEIGITDIKISQKLNEIKYGELEGERKALIRKKIPKYHNNIYFKNPKGESFKDLEKRIIKKIKELEGKKENILIVTHAGCMRVIYSYYTHTPLEKNITMKISHETVYRCNKTKKGKNLKIIYE